MEGETWEEDSLVGRKWGETQTCLLLCFSSVPPWHVVKSGWSRGLCRSSVWETVVQVSRGRDAGAGRTPGLHAGAVQWQLGKVQRWVK